MPISLNAEQKPVIHHQVAWVAAESLLQGYNAGTWFGVVTRAGTAKPIIDKLNRESVAALKAGELNERLTAIGFDVFTGTPEEFGQFMQNDIARAAKVIKAAGIKAAE